MKQGKQVQRVIKSVQFVYFQRYQMLNWSTHNDDLVFTHQLYLSKSDIPNSSHKKVLLSSLVYVQFNFLSKVLCLQPLCHCVLLPSSKIFQINSAKMATYTCRYSSGHLIPIIQSCEDEL